jgi:aspartate kinase/aspartokinase/homoserine dehydrogenase 1
MYAKDIISAYMSYVIKLGGSAFRQPEDLQQVLHVIRNYNNPVVVTSAFYGVTNEIETVFNHIITSNTLCEEKLSSLFKWHRAFVIENFETPSSIKAALGDLSNELEKFRYIAESLLDAVCSTEKVEINGDLILKHRAELLCYGELFASCILNALLNHKNIPSERVLPEQMGLICEDNYNDAGILIEESQTFADYLIQSHCLTVIPGFYAVNSDKEICLLGRSGSDYSAAAIATLIDAPGLDLYKDVDGFSSCDPNFIENTKTIAKLNYEEASELAYFGAGILHPETIKPLREKEIPIRIFNIRKQVFGLDGLKRLKRLNGLDGLKRLKGLDGLKRLNGLDGCCTLIDGNGAEVESVKSIAFSDRFAVIRLKGALLGLKPGIIANVSETLNQHGINISSIITSQIAINIILLDKDLEKAYKLIAGLELNAVSFLEKEEQLCLIAVVGSSMTTQFGIAADIYRALAEQKVNVRLSSLGASEVTSYLLINRAHKAVAVKAIHDKLFSNQLEIINA